MHTLTLTYMHTYIDLFTSQFPNIYLCENPRSIMYLFKSLSLNFYIYFILDLSICLSIYLVYINHFVHNTPNV